MHFTEYRRKAPCFSYGYVACNRHDCSWLERSAVVGASCTKSRPRDNSLIQFYYLCFHAVDFVLSQVSLHSILVNKKNKTYCFKLKPTPAQEQVFAPWLGSCRFMYNLCFEYKQFLCNQYRKSKCVKEHPC